MLEVQRLATAAVQASLTGRNLNQTLADIWRKNSRLPYADRAAIQDLSFGALRFYGSLSAILNRLLLKPISDEQLRVLLIVALYQLQYTKAKSFAIVDHAVSTAHSLGKTAAKGLVNAVLRNFLRRQEELLSEALKDEVARFNFPHWWIAKLKKQFPQHWQQMLEVANRLPPMTLRVNRRRCTVDGYLEQLNNLNIHAHHLEGDAIVLTDPMSVDKLPGFLEGLVSVQDASAQYSVRLLDLQPGMRVLDACSAPGGKTGHLLETADIHLVALDSDAERLERVEDNLVRLNLRADLKAADAAAIDTWWDGQLFDRILVDAPCSGSGVTRRHPDIKWARRPTDIQQFVAQQQRLLSALWPSLKVGGKLLYATCSVFSEENHELIVSHLSRCKDACLLPLTQLTTIDGQIVPDDFHDGFFYALLAKI